jgi:hypothetical protein
MLAVQLATALATCLSGRSLIHGRRAHGRYLDSVIKIHRGANGPQVLEYPWLKL